MRIPPKVIDKISDEIFKRLEADGDVEYGEAREDVFEKIKDMIFEDVKREDELDSEVREIIEKNIAKFEGIPPHRMFSHIKRQLVKERNLII